MNNSDKTSYSTAQDDTELIAVISAAIAAYAGGGNMAIKSITKKDSSKKMSNWVRLGRQEAFNSRRNKGK
jgi:hypothetical protein